MTPTTHLTEAFFPQIFFFGSYSKKRSRVNLRLKPLPHPRIMPLQPAHSTRSKALNPSVTKKPSSASAQDGMLPRRGFTSKGSKWHPAFTKPGPCQKQGPPATAKKGAVCARAYRSICISAMCLMCKRRVCIPFGHPIGNFFSSQDTA